MTICNPKTVIRALWKITVAIIIHCCQNRGWNQKQKPLAVTRRKIPDNNMISKGCIKSPKRFCMVGTRYFASASNDWYSIWYHSYGRTWSITSLPGLVFRRRRSTRWKHAEGMSLRYGVIVLGDLIQPPLEIILSSGVFRRETASGFYPWGQCGMPS